MYSSKINVILFNLIFDYIKLLHTHSHIVKRKEEHESVIEDLRSVDGVVVILIEQIIR